MKNSQQKAVVAVEISLKKWKVYFLLALFFAPVAVLVAYITGCSGVYIGSLYFNKFFISNMFAGMFYLIYIWKDVKKAVEDND